ncbi:UrcA family protein [uncultured Erythrobacter sp.]|uniref:UrcA family protein n=1 Tax=uncultured Erythrobacter sp. TaxID=263913 RepID=UPI00261145E0|nr:UrcA family protein [uncultured Erythrobacter sp.]
MRFVAALIAPAIALAAVPAAASGINANDFSAEVEIDGVDLTTQKGVALLDERLKTIIRQKCANGGRDTQSLRLERACRASARAAVKDQVRFAILEAKATKVRLAQGTPVSPQG